MEAKQETREEDTDYDEEEFTQEENAPQERTIEDEEHPFVEEAVMEEPAEELKEEPTEQGEEQMRERIQRAVNNGMSNQENNGSFVHGLSVGLGLGCIATFVIMWVAVFFTPQLPSSITYEAMLSVFIYPMIYLLTVGLIALTAGIVREYYVRKSRF